MGRALGSALYVGLVIIRSLVVEFLAYLLVLIFVWRRVLASRDTRLFSRVVEVGPVLLVTCRVSVW